MNGTINLGKRVESLDISEQFSGVSKLVCNIDDNTKLTAGNDSGYTIEFDNPFMTQTILNNMLSRIRGYQYQPLKASKAILNPAAELGDGLSVNGEFSALFNRERKFDSLMLADIEAPTDEEIDHEYKFETPETRKFKREMGNFSSELIQQSNLIAAKVSSEGSSTTSGHSFGWELTNTKHEWKADGNTVMKVTATGLEVKGKVTATSGYIGNGSSGFTISNTAIYNGLVAIDSASTADGVYLGVDGIRLGNNFKVTKSGAVTASSITATGGYIGSQASGFSIGSSSIWNKINSMSSTLAEGVYLGTDGIKLGNKFKVTKGGAVTASSLAITGGSININDKFIVSDTGVLTADFTSGSISLGKDADNNIIFNVTSQGAVTARNLKILGGSITIQSTDSQTGTTTKFSVSSTGAVTATNLKITGGSISIKDGNGVTAFSVSSAGAVTASNLKVTGGTINISEKFKVDSGGNVTIKGGSININDRFKVSSTGAVTATALTVQGGSISLGGTAEAPNFKVSSTGTVTIKQGSISIGLNSDNQPMFQVTSAGAVTARSLKLIGGSITIGTDNANSFRVDSNGNLKIGNKFSVSKDGNITASSGTFSGNVYAKNIKYGTSGSTDYGTISGGAITAGSIYDTQVASHTLGTAEFVEGVGTSLGYANFSHDLFFDNASGSTKADYLVSNYLNVTTAVNLPQTIISGNFTFYDIYGNAGGITWCSENVVTGVSLNKNYTQVTNDYGTSVYVLTNGTSLGVSTTKLTYLG